MPSARNNDGSKRISILEWGRGYEKGYNVVFEDKKRQREREEFPWVYNESDKPRVIIYDHNL